MIQRDSCEDLSLCNVVAKVGSTKRELVDKLTRVVDVQEFDDISSSYYQAACSWMNFLEDKEEKDLSYSGLIQYFYLALVYFDTNGEEWTNSSLWITNVTFCDWHGIECDAHDIVTSLRLPSNNLRGTIPTEIARLRGLENLLFNDNHLSGTIPREIGTGLRRLLRLKISNNRITGSLPSEIGGLAKLIEMGLSSNQLTNSLPTEIGLLRSIQEFNVYSNLFFGELPDELFELADLKRINLGSNLFSGGAKIVERLLDLESLDLSDNGFTGSIPMSIHQNQLRVLRLSGNHFSGSIPTSIEELKALEIFFLYNNWLTGIIPSQIGYLESLSKVSFSYNSIQGPIPSEIGNLRNLSLLHLHNNRLTGVADYFNYPIDAFVTDCGNTLAAEALVDCKNCSSCCNIEGDCLFRNQTYLSEAVEETVFTFIGFVFIVIFFSCIALVIIIIIAIKFRCFSNRDTEFSACKEFQKESTYKLLLTNDIRANIFATLTVGLQIAILYIFVWNSDFNERLNDWEYSTRCSNDEVHCEDTRHATPFGWFVFVCILFSFLLKDFFEGVKMIYGSFILGSWRGGVAGFVVVFITIVSFGTSWLYNLATGISDTNILKDAAILLFLNDIDEQVYAIIELLFPSWLDKQNQVIAKHLNKRINRRPKYTSSTDDVESPIPFSLSNDELSEVDSSCLKNRANIRLEHLPENGLNEIPVAEELEREFRSEYENMNVQTKNIVELEKELNVLKTDYANMKNEYINDHSNLQSKYEQLENDNNNLQIKYKQLESDHSNVKKELKVLHERFEAFAQKIESKI